MHILLCQGHQNQREGRLAYADVDHDNPSEVKKMKPAGGPATPNSDVEYSLINYNLNICYEDTQLEGQQKRGMVYNNSNNIHYLMLLGSQN